jgi:cold shock CspA family protein
MGRSRETYSKKEVRNKKEKKRKEKEKKRLARKEDKEKKGGLDDMIAYVDENGVISSTPPDPTKKKEIIAENIEVSVQKNDDIEDVDQMRQGRLVTFNESKGYGFIKDAETQVTLFVHINDFIDDIKVEDKVSFKAEKGKKGPVAVNVSLLK